jgi:hypothetical protein
MLSTAWGGGTFVGAGPVAIGDATAGNGLTISGEGLMTGSGTETDSICVEPGK